MPEPKTDRYVCIEPDCTKGRATGHALYRTSPKGELFEGACEDHFGSEVEPIAQAIERRNHGADPGSSGVAVKP